MVRSYGNNSDTTSTAREVLLEQQAHEKEVADKIERIIIVAAIMVAVLSIAVNTIRCVHAVSAKNKYNKQKIEATTTYKDLQAKLQDPEAQNLSYVDPTVGNMTEIGQDIASMQNQIIAGQQALHNMNSQPETSSASGLATEAPDDTEDMHKSPTSKAGSGTVTLNPAESVSPRSETPANDITSTETTNQNTMQDASVNNAAFTGSQADLIKEFQTKYFQKPIANVDSVDVNSAAWSWYGVWEFSETYDFSAQEVPAMPAVWICYEPSDTKKVKPLAFVTATYSPAQKGFTNAEATYTQNYIHYSEAQKDAFGSESAGNDLSTESANSDSSPESQQNTKAINGQGSENEYKVVNIDNGKSDKDTSATDKSSNGNNVSNNSSRNNDSSSSVTDSKKNPNGIASWNSGASYTGNSSKGTWTPSGNSNLGAWNPSGGTGTWAPSGNAPASNDTGTWTPSGNSSTSGSTGTWTPSGNSSTPNSTGTWTPAH